MGYSLVLPNAQVWFKVTFERTVWQINRLLENYGWQTSKLRLLQPNVRWPCRVLLGANVHSIAGCVQEADKTTFFLRDDSPLNIRANNAPQVHHSIWSPDHYQKNNSFSFKSTQWLEHQQCHGAQNSKGSQTLIWRLWFLSWTLQPESHLPCSFISESCTRQQFYLLFSWTPVRTG